MTPSPKDPQRLRGLRLHFLKVIIVGIFFMLLLLFFFFQSTVANDRHQLAKRYAKELAHVLSERENLVFSTPPEELVSISRHGNIVWQAPYLGDIVSGNYHDIQVEIQAPLYPTQQYIFILFVFIVLASSFIIVLYAWFGVGVITPLRSIQLAAERAASGNFTLPIDEIPSYEFGAVASNFNAMFLALENYQDKLEHRLEELQDANISLKNTQASLVRSEKLASVGQLAAGIAHEIGNPLAAVSGYIEFLEDSDLEAEESRDILRRVSKQLDRIRTIIRSLLDYSRQDTDAIETTDLSQMIHQAIELAKAIPRTRKINFIFTDTKEKFVFAIPSQVIQILLNLILNAVDAIEESSELINGVITFEVTAPNAYIHLTVTDNGPGISKENFAKVFDPFFTSKEPGKGTGLGLAIVHQMMTAIGGDIFVENDAKGGARFTLIFPRPD